MGLVILAKAGSPSDDDKVRVCTVRQQKELVLVAKFYMAVLKGKRVHGAAVTLLLTIVAAKAHQERLLQLVTLAFKEEALELALPLDMRFLTPAESLDEICNGGVQIFGT